MKTRFERFLEDAQAKGGEAYRNTIRGNGGFEYNQQVSDLMKLSNNLNYNLLCYLFGERLGEHLANVFSECDRNLLAFFMHLDGQYRFFILHELKTNENLFGHC